MAKWLRLRDHQRERQEEPEGERDKSRRRDGDRYGRRDSDRDGSDAEDRWNDREEDDTAGGPDEAETEDRDDRPAGSRRNTASRPGARPRPRPGSISGTQAVRQAKQHLSELTGHACESVCGLSPAEDGGWKVTLEVLELERIPRTTDILATYEVELDESGELLGYERINRYYRNQAGSD